MVKVTRRLLSAGASALAAAGCSPLTILDAVAPRDRGARKAASGLAYGPGPRQTVDVYVPETATSQALPLLVFFYGGSWKFGTKEEYGFVGSAFASRGFVTVLPDYRIYPEVRFPDFLDDCAAAVRLAQAQAGRFGADGSRIGLAGHSAGAYNAAMLALDPRYLQRAGVAPRSVTAWAGLSGPYDFLPLDPGTAQELFGAAPNKPATQPITFAGRASPPAYLATGGADDTVRPRNTMRLAARLRGSGVTVSERVFPKLDHKDTLLALSVLFRGSAPILDEASTFLAQHVGGG